MSSTVARHRRGAFALTTALALAACGGATDGTESSSPAPAPTSTQPSTADTTGSLTEPTEPESTTSMAVPTSVLTQGSEVAAPEVEKVLFADVGDFVEAYDLANDVVAVEPVERFEITVESLTVGSLPSGGEGFVATDLFDAGILAGTIDPDGTISAVTVLVDPDGETAAAAVSSLLFSTAGTAGSFGVVEFAEIYAPFAADRIEEPEAQFWLAGPEGSPYSLVGTIVEGAEPPDNLIEIAIVPIPTQNEAQVVVQFLRPELLGLVDTSAG